jgi:hypothetical protein
VPETVFYMRGPFPFGSGHQISEKFVSDTKLLVSLTDEKFESLKSDVCGYPGFMSRSDLTSIVAKYFQDAAIASRVATLILAIDERRRLHRYQIGKLADEIAQWQRENKSDEGTPSLLTDDELLIIRERFPAFFGSIPGLERHEKARNLSEKVGQPLERMELICDLRPVFDVDRQRVEGMIPVTTLRLVCKAADGLPVAFDAILSEKDVLSLARATSDAKKKLKRLREVLGSSGIEIPDLNGSDDEANVNDDEEK